MPQVLSGDAQVVPQTPPEQTWPAGQPWPQVPQLALSVWVLTSQPLAATLSQLAKPVVQLATPQTPAVQLALALGSAHAWPQAPQLAVLVWVLTSQPSEAVPSQSPKPVAQRTTAAGPAGATVGRRRWAARRRAGPQRPQLAGSTPVLAQKAVDPVPQTVERGRAGGAADTTQTDLPGRTAMAAGAAVGVVGLGVDLAAVGRDAVAVGEARGAARDAADTPRCRLSRSRWAARRPCRTRRSSRRCSSRVLVSQPLEATPSQSPKPAVQRTIVHAPLAQPSAATSASAQAAPQAPQRLAGSIAVFAQNVAGAVPQVLSGEAQVVPSHTPPAAKTEPAARRPCRRPRSWRCRSAGVGLLAAVGRGRVVAVGEARRAGGDGTHTGRAVRGRVGQRARVRPQARRSSASVVSRLVSAAAVRGQAVAVAEARVAPHHGAGAVPCGSHRPRRRAARRPPASAAVGGVDRGVRAERRRPRAAGGQRRRARGAAVPA